MTDRYLTRDFRKYELVIPGSIYEIQVQSIVERNIASIFPGHVGKILEPYFKTSAGDVKPDLVIIKSDYSGWGIVEVESEVHSFSAHILPQLTKMSYANADQRVIKKISDSFKNEIPPESLLEVLIKKPVAYLAMHGSSAKYLDNLNEINVQCIDFQIHKKPPGDYILDVIDYRTEYEPIGFLVRRIKSPIFRNLWTADSSAPRFPKELNEIRITLNGQSANWAVNTLDGSSTFRAPADLPIPENLEIVKAYRQKDVWALKWEFNENYNLGD